MMPAGDVGVATVQSDQRLGDLGGIVDDGQAVGFGESPLPDPGGELVLTQDGDTGRPGARHHEVGAKAQGDLMGRRKLGAQASRADSR